MMASEQLTLPTILCCICGLEMHSNPTNMCASCLHDRVDITQEVNKKMTIHSCRTCHRWLGPPWQSLELESKELMALCLRKINGLNKNGIKLIDAAWIWTEPHSLRLKIKLSLQKEIMNGAIVQQSTVAEYVIRNQQCRMCEANFAQGSWRALVQVRQRVEHKRTFYFLEQLILKHEAHSECMKIMTFRDGIDFYFKDRNQALRFVAFLKDVVPTRETHSRKLVSADKKSNIADYRHNVLVEIAPVCKDDLIVLPRDLAAKQSNISPLCLVRRVGSGLYVVDPNSGERTDINSEKYWRYNFKSFLSSRHLQRYVVLDVEPVIFEHKASARMRRTGSKQKQTHNVTRAVSKLATVTVAREKDMGQNDNQYVVNTHIGPLLSAGDIVLGYDLATLKYNFDDAVTEQLQDANVDIPEVVLVRKFYDKERSWTLKQMDVDHDESTNNKKDNSMEVDREIFLQQIESDREMRAHMNLFRATDKANNSFVPTRQYDEEEVRLDELLEEMELADEDDEEEDVPATHRRRYEFGDEDQDEDDL